MFPGKTVEYFRYLVTEFGYNEPVHRLWQQENGTITRDEFKYVNLIVNRGIIISNAYHPVDYGFEICFFKPNSPTKIQEEEMVFYVLKEDQDIEQRYLENAAGTLRADFSPIVKGDEWVKNKRNGS
jgi:hypothetical protein